MDLIDQIAARVAQGHAGVKHLKKFAPLGVTTEAEFQAHIATVLRDPTTLGFMAYDKVQPWRQADMYYHPQSNTFIVVPENPADEPTAHRPKTEGAFFHGKLKEAQALSRETIPFFNGFSALQAHKERRRNTALLAANLRREPPPGAMIPMGENPIIVKRPDPEAPQLPVTAAHQPANPEERERHLLPEIFRQAAVPRGVKPSP